MTSDYVSMVNEYHQKAGLDLPTYSFVQNDKLVWSCSLYDECASAMTKKKAKSLVAQQWYENNCGYEKNVNELAQLFKKESENFTGILFHEENMNKLASIAFEYLSQ